MSYDFQQMLLKYAELTVRVGLNLQPGQRLVIGDPLFNFGVPIQVAPLVRLIAASAYKAGARFVDVMWGDDRLHLIRFQHAPHDSFEEFPTWQPNGMLEYVKRGDALLSILANNPDLLNDQDPELIATVQKTAAQQFHPTMEYITRNATNWCAMCAAVPGWAAKVFPNLPREEQEAKLWNSIFEICRLNRADPISTWRNHVNDLAARAKYLDAKQYSALKFTAPGTNLLVGLPKGHVWESGQLTSESGIAFTANMPTEEIFTLPHRDKTEGVVTATKPLSYGGTLIENFSLTFAGGRVVNATAKKGETILRQLIETDAGAGRLGEVALVPHSSPISQSGLLFYNPLIDENAACHIALGQAYKFSLEGGSTLSDEEFASAGGNQSIAHADLMIGSGEVSIDGMTVDDTSEPIMRNGEWAFGV
jgi:aminopeptidase